MSAYAVVGSIALILLSLAGFTTAATWTSVGLLLVSFALHIEFLRLRRNGAHEGRPALPPRNKLDRLVRVQWLGASISGLAAATILSATATTPLSSADHLVKALIVALLVGSLAVFVSSLIDWYVILPKVSGISGAAPCESTGGERWKYTTAIWYLHRAVATALVSGAVTAIPLYMATVSPSERPGWSVVAGLFAAITLRFNSEVLRVFWFFLGPPVYVGDQIYVDVADDGEGDVRVWRRRAYVVDVALQGAKYKVLRDARYIAVGFLGKHEKRIPNADLPDRKAPDSELPVCRDGRSVDGCSRVNWYCRHNPHAHD